MRALGFSFLMRRAVRTIGVMAMLMHSACWGNSFFAITLHAGQQDVPMNGILAGTSSMKSFALVDGAQIGTDSDLGHIGEAQLTHSLLQFGGGHTGELVDEGGGRRWQRPRHRA